VDSYCVSFPRWRATAFRGLDGRRGGEGRGLPRRPRGRPPPGRGTDPAGHGRTSHKAAKGVPSRRTPRPRISASLTSRVRSSPATCSRSRTGRRCGWRCSCSSGRRPHRGVGWGRASL